MRSKVVRTLALALVLASVGFGLGQEKNPRKKVRVEEEEEAPRTLALKSAPPKSKLEEMLAEALKNNPDIRVAAAKMAEAEAELNRTRIQVTQQVATLHQAILSQKAAVDLAQKKSDRYQGLLKDRAIDVKLADEQLAQLTLTKAKLAELEAQIPALLGKMQTTAAATTAPLALYRYRLDFDNDGDLGFPVLKAKVNIPQAEKLRKALQTPVKVDYKDMTFEAILNDLSKKVEGLSFRNLFDRGGGLSPEPKINLRFEEALPVSAILQALADENRGCIFYVREYGILATNIKTPGALTVEEFLRQKPADEPRRQPIGKKNPPHENVEGQVKKIDSSSNLMTLTIGSDAGLVKGHTLELFRLNPASPSESRYLGTIRILETEAREALAQPVGRLTDKPKVGDRVASRLLGQ